LELIVLDDGYEPSRTVPNMNRLVDRDDVVAIVGNVGTPTAIAALPIAARGRIPFFGAFTGAGVLRRTPPDHYVINYRASYAEETAAMVDALVREVGLDPKEIAFFTQRDGYGDAGFSGGVAALEAHGLERVDRVAHARYERNTLAVEGGLADLVAADPQPKAVIMVGSYGPCAKFIELARSIDFHPLFLNVSFVGAESLARALGDRGDEVIVTQVVPHLDSKAPIVAEYTDALRKVDEKATKTFVSLEGYIVGRILCRALGEIDGAVTREDVVTALEGLGEFDLGTGSTLRLSSEEHQASHQVWPTILRGGRVVPFQWSRLRSRNKP
ncbi:MAG: ABC transporter substrate-binding protein, partial [Planctomycetes bacterium]|nr:ABC transporter substrate-binding protein [Planctomycetota bacterium]